MMTIDVAAAYLGALVDVMSDQFGGDALTVEVEQSGAFAALHAAGAVVVGVDGYEVSDDVGVPMIDALGRLPGQTIVTTVRVAGVMRMLRAFDVAASRLSQTQ